MQQYTIEARDEHGIPIVQARISAPSLATALVNAFDDGNKANWTFLQATTAADAIDRLTGHTSDEPPRP